MRAEVFHVQGDETATGEDVASGEDVRVKGKFMIRRRETRRLDEHLFVEDLQIVFSKVLGAAEECRFGFRQAVCAFEFFAREFKRARYVGDLKKPILCWFDVGDKLCSGGKKGEGLFDEPRQGGLPVVVIDLKFVEGVEFGRVGDKELSDLLEQWVVYVLSFAPKVLVDAETAIRDVGFAHEGDHAVKDTTALLSRLERVLFFPADEGPGMNAKVGRQPHDIQRFAELFKIGRKIFCLIVENHANQIIPRRSRGGLKTSRFVNKNADFFGSLVHNRCLVRKTKARITPRLRQETFPRAGDSGFRLCRRVFYHNCGFGRNRGNSTILGESFAKVNASNPCVHFGKSPLF